MAFRVAIVGRPNVGKSTLFNRLVGRSQALVDPTPGVTRDRIEGNAQIGGLAFEVFDTAGLAEGKADDLEARLLKQTEQAVAAADLAAMVIDAKSGLTALDRRFADWLRRQSTPVILVANKSEGLAAESFASEAWALGLGAPVLISAQNKEGMADLAEAIMDQMATLGVDPDEAAVSEEVQLPLRLAVAGRPNVGKSSLINRLLRDDRLLTGPEPGLTRDAVRISWQWQDRQIELVDTAGLRKRARIEDTGLEKLSSKASLAAIRQADVVLLMIDATAPLERQDLIIANRVLDAGRALMVACNKWDLVTDSASRLGLIKNSLESRLPQIKGVPCMPISVRTGQNVERILPAVVELEGKWSRRVSTASLNRWLATATDDHAPPLVKGRRVKIRYATQVSTRPPTIALFVSQANALPESYLRYLANSLRTQFAFEGVPLRLLERSGKNPYAPAR